MQNDIMPLIVYKNREQITTGKQLPVPHSSRICTDLFCTLFATISIVIIFVIALLNFNLNKLIQSTYPTDIQGRLCTLHNNNYNYLYFTSPKDPTKRLCVSECPQGDQKSLKCLPSERLSCRQNSNIEFEVMIYASQASDTNMGLFCFPKNQKLKLLILKNSKLHQKYLFVSTYRSISYSALCGVVLGALFLVLCLLIPRFMTYASILLGGISCIGVGILIMVVHSQMLQVYQTIRIIFCVFMILMGIMCIISFFFKSQDLKHCSAFLSTAGKYLSQQLVLVLLISAYYILMFFVFVVIIFQILAYWSHGDLLFNPQQITKQLGGTYSTIMIIICAIQFFWMMSFLKQSFGFLVSGNYFLIFNQALQYIIISKKNILFHFHQVFIKLFELGNLFKFHWGSVVAGSFLLNFFYVFDTFYDFIKPEVTQSRFSQIFCLCDRILGFARSDAFSFINLVGVPYCNSARYCEQIDDRSVFFEGSQSIFRFFRIGGHIMLGSICCLLTYILMYFLSDSKQISVLGLLLSFLINLFVVTFFVSLIAQIAQAMLLCNLVQKYLKNQDQIKNAKKQKQKQNNNHQGYTIHQTQQ